MKFQILITSTTPTRGVRLLQAIHAGAVSAGLDASITTSNVDQDSALILYGVGGADRWGLAHRHLNGGGRLIVWDAGYWDRKLPDRLRRYRLSIDALHPQKLIMQGPTPSPRRFRESGLRAGNKGNPDGPILLVGNGPKSNAVGALGWAAAKSQEIKAAFPGKKIVYRPKPRKPQESDVFHNVLSVGPIESALSSVSLVVCRHSNVAVDACRYGVPVVCDDGAAAAIYPQKLADYEAQPSQQTRQEFLNRLAWWQWSQHECQTGVLWPWLLKVLNVDNKSLPVQALHS